MADNFFDKINIQNIFQNLSPDIMSLYDTANGKKARL